MKVLSLTPHMSPAVTASNNFHHQIPFDMIHQSEIYTSLKSFLQITRFLTGIPLVKVGESGNIQSPKVFSVANLFAVGLLVNSVALLGFSIGRNSDFVATSGPEIIQRTHIVLVYLFSLISSSKLVRTLKQSPLIEKRLGIYTEPEDCQRLRYYCRALWISFLAAGFGLTMSSALDCAFGPEPAWTRYSQVACGLPRDTLLHHGLTNAYCLVSNVVSNFVWFYGDFWVTLLSLIFTSFYVRLLRGIGGLDPSRFSVYEIDLVREHFGILAKLVQDFDDYIAPLNLLSVGFNTWYIVTSGYALILVSTSTKSIHTDTATRVVLVVMAVSKMALGMVTASQLHYKARQAVVTVRAWPMTRDAYEYSMNHSKIWIIEAFIIQLSTSPKTGFGLGTVTKIKYKIVVYIALGIVAFLAFSRITTSTCSR